MNHNEDVLARLAKLEQQGAQTEELNSKVQMVLDRFDGLTELLANGFSQNNLNFSGLDKGAQNSLSYGQNLDNRTNDLPIVPLPESEGNEMPSKYHEKVKIGVDASGKPIYKHVYGNTREAVQIGIAKALAGTLGDDCTLNKQEPESELWEDWAQNWYEVFERPKLKPKKQNSNDSLMKLVIAGLRGKRLNEITPMNIQQALNEYSDYSESYLRDMKSLMSQALDAAFEEGKVQRNAAKSRMVHIPSNKVTERKALTTEEQEDIIANIDKLERVNDRRFVAMLMFTGMRPGEAYGLRWEDIDFGQHLIYVERAVYFCKGKGVVSDTKTEAGNRVIPLDDRLIQFLGERKEEGYVLAREKNRWCKGDDEVYSEQAAKRMWERIKSTIDMHGITPYSFRHTYATQMSKNGVPMKAAMQIMGHKDERPLARAYIHTDLQDVIDAGKKMSGYYSTICQQ